MVAWLDPFTTHVLYDGDHLPTTKQKQTETETETENKNDLTAFDARENGYQRVRVPREMVQLLSWQKLPADAAIYVYVPYAPAVVERYGTDESTGLPLCSGPDAPPGLDQVSHRANESVSLSYVSQFVVSRSVSDSVRRST